MMPEEEKSVSNRGKQSPESAGRAKIKIIVGAFPPGTMIKMEVDWFPALAVNIAQVSYRRGIGASHWGHTLPRLNMHAQLAI